MGRSRSRRRLRRRPGRHSPAQGRRARGDHGGRPDAARIGRARPDKAMGDDGDAERRFERRLDRRRRRRPDVAIRRHGHGPQRSRQGDAGEAHSRPPDHDRMACELRGRRARPRRRHHRRRLQRHQGSRRLPRSNVCRAATWASTARRSFIRPRSTSATKRSRRPPRRWSTRPRSSRRSRCRKTLAGA